MENVESIVNSLCLSQPQQVFTISSNNFAFTNCGYTGDTVQSGMTFTSNWSGPYVQWWPTYWPTVYEDRTAKAFRVVKALMDSKVVTVKGIKQFIGLVDEISKVL
jgi:hypothetical protein